MLSHVRCGATVGHDIYLDEWIETLQTRYEYFLAHAETQEIDDTHPRLPGLYNVLYNLNLHLAAQPTSIYTLTVAALHDEGCSLLKVSTSAMNGNIICEGIFPRTASIGVPVSSVLRQLELPFRVYSFRSQPVHTSRICCSLWPRHRRNSLD